MKGRVSVFRVRKTCAYKTVEIVMMDRLPGFLHARYGMTVVFCLEGKLTKVASGAAQKKQVATQQMSP